jgi:predicted nuclease of restriction endonuclease-like (RecB) superfamily
LLDLSWSKKTTPKPDTNTMQIPQYADWLADWKGRIQRAQIKAAIRVNTELLQLYWALGSDIVAKQETTAWGEGLIPRLAKDLKTAFPHLTGFSSRNLFYIRNWFLFYQHEIPIVPQVVGQLENEIVPQVVAQLQAPDNEWIAVFFAVPWGHHRHVIDKCTDTQEAIFYLKKTVENNWSRDALRAQMKQGLYARQGKAITNFERTMPKPQSDLAIEMLKTPIISTSSTSVWKRWNGMWRLP